MQRRIAHWIEDAPSKVEVFPRPLSYPPQEGREKGVDVELAIDMVRLAMDEEFDVTVLASTDTDLMPPLQFILDRLGNAAIETAAFEPVPGQEAETAEPLDVSGGGIARRHKIKSHVFDKAISDRRNFTTMSGDPGKNVDKARWEKVSDRIY